ncbi:hypothetical protein ACHAXT_009502 [Thalassiosira profunda]
MAAALARRRGVLALALSSPLSSAFQPRTLRRAPSPSSRLVLARARATSSAAVDDPSLTNNEDYEWLRRSRPMRIRARPVLPNDGGGDAADKDTEGARKVVHFLRHGQGTHNQLYKEWTDRTGVPLDLSETDPVKNPMLLPEIVDARLTQKGMDQCAQTRSAASELQGIELVVVSPLMRTLETAHIAFEDHLPHNAGARNVKWIAHEGIREELGMLMCNRRRPLSETAIEFPHVDYTHLPEGEEDTLWDAYAEQNTNGGITQRESIETMSHRAYHFLTTFVHKRPEREMAVVGHSAWLLAMTGAVLDVHEEGEEGAITSMFGQAELRSLELVFSEQ